MPPPQTTDPNADAAAHARHEHRLTLVARYTDNAVIVTDARGGIEWVNEGFTRITGYTLDEVRGRKPGHVLQGPRTDLREVAKVREAVRRGEPVVAELLNYAKDGREYWLRLDIKPIFEEPHGAPRRLTGFLAVETDITADRELALRLQEQGEALRRETAMLSAFVEHAPAAIAMLDRDLRYLAVSRAWELTFGIPAGDAAGRPHAEAVAGQPRHWQEAYARCLAGATHRCDDEPFTLPGGRRIALRWEARPWTTPSGAVGGLLMWATDITDAKKRDTEVSAVRAQAEAARLKGEFLANMSHEVRTPLTTLLGYTDLLTDPQTDDALRAEVTPRIRAAGAQVLKLINDILDFSRLASGAAAIDRAPVELAPLIAELDAALRPRLAQGVSLRFTLAGPLPSAILADAGRLRQVLTNIVGNAVKFTRAGAVTVTLGARTSPEGDRLVFDVADTGPGIDPATAAHLFTPFSQSDGSMSRAFGGTGLGLAISRRIALAMGGDITLTATARGAGSTFRLDLPLAPAPGAAGITSLGGSAPTAAPVQQNRLAGRILLVEDGPDNQRLISLHLRKAGSAVDIADNGVAALKLIDATGDAPYDLIVSDMQMPEMDGYTLARTLRQRGSTLPIIAVTAHALPGDREDCLRAGCSDYATKPISREVLIGACARWLKERVHKPAA